MLIVNYAGYIKKCYVLIPVEKKESQHQVALGKGLHLDIAHVGPNIYFLFPLILALGGHIPCESLLFLCV